MVGMFLTFTIHNSQFTIIMAFQESIDYLHSLGNEVSAMKLGLENVKTLLDALGNPETKYKKIQVAGTNGKGSTCAFLEAICVAAGIKIGLTTSPHLVSITERIRIGGAEISNEDFARLSTLIKETSEKLVGEKKLETVPTFFEQITAIALTAFAEAKIELAILETGLGGRFDAATAARASIVAITPIDFDHEKILGETLAKIAAEKAAIIRADTPVVLAKQREEAEAVLSRVCAERVVAPIRTETVAVGEESKIAKSKSNAKPQIENKPKSLRLNFKTTRAEYKNINLSLRGRHQIENAKVAILLAEILRADFKITNENICEGLQTAVHKGRLEFYENFLFDGAHNVAGAKALRAFLDEFITQPMTIVFGAMNDKNLREISAILFPKADRLIFTKADNSRSVEPQDLLNFAGELKTGAVFTTENVAEAIALARRIAAQDDLILITGSLYLIGEAQKILRSK